MPILVKSVNCLALLDPPNEHNGNGILSYASRLCNALCHYPSRSIRLKLHFARGSVSFTFQDSNLN